MNIIRGWLGEKMTAFAMWLFLDKSLYRRFHDVIIPTENGTTQIDHLLISPFGLFVIETKNIRGWIFGSEDQPTWAQTLYGQKNSFQNPVHQNYRHTRCLAEYLKVEPALLHSIIFFIGDCTFKTQMPPNVIRTGLSSYIRKHQHILLSSAEIIRITSAIQAIKADRSLTRRAHMQSLQKRHSSTTICPKCGASLVERIAKKGRNMGSKFLGCATYPRCRYTKQAEAK